MKKVLVGLSGGIDSSFSLYLLKEMGYEVAGVSMKIWDGRDMLNVKKKGGCYGPKEEEEIRDAEEVCKILKVPFYVFDLSKEYKKEVLEYVKEEYKRGRTPNPCVLCNRKIKFGLLLKLAKKSGISFDYFATGHYARIEKNGENYILKKGIDEKKDQSYFLWKIKKEQLKNILFPLGNWKKEDVKREVKKLKFPVLDKPESQDFFEGDLDFLIPKTKKGPIKDLKGNILGEHKGISHYTIGQRKGLGISYKEPLYVLKIDQRENTIFVGTKKDCFQRKFSVKYLNWLYFENLKDFSCFVKIRYKHIPAKAKVEIKGREAFVEFEEPQLSITPGQSAVFYNGEILLGGGIIDFVYE